MSDTVYGYFTVNIAPEFAHDGNTGYICVRVDRPAKGSDSTTYRASYSFCSPKDAPKRAHELGKPFKTLSKRIANCRMNTSRVKSSVVFEYKKCDSTTLPDVFRAALDYVLALPENNGIVSVPYWCEKAAFEYGLPTNSSHNKAEAVAATV